MNGTARWLLALALTASWACGGKPVMSKVPQPDPKKVAVGATAAGTVLTLANPDLVGKKPPEEPGKAEIEGKKTSGETAPAGVLDRLDAQPRSAQDGDEEEELPYCSELRARRASVRLELIPSPHPPPAPKPGTNCRPDPREDDEGDRP